MLRSMTGFGRCLVESEGFTQQWEVKSVNSRHLDLKWRLPMSVRSLEPRLEKVVRRFASRGRVDISLTLQYTGGTGPAPRFDAMQAEAMLDSLKELAARRGEPFTPDYNALLALPGLWGDAGDEVDESLTLALEEGLSLALEDWNDARAAEGREWLSDRGDGLPMNRSICNDRWRKLCAARGIEHIPWSNLRNSWRTIAEVELRLPWDLIEMLMGHALPGVSGRHYIRPTAEQVVRAAFDALGIS